MKWEKALKYTRKHTRMIAVMMAGVIGFACFYSADASVIKDFISGIVFLSIR